jgi:hypothetical protein
MVVSEDNLNVNTLCPLMDIELSSTDIEECAYALLRWAILRKQDGLDVELPKLREKYVNLWNKKWFKDQEIKVPDTGPYWEGPKKARIVAKRIYDLLLEYEILTPEQPYKLVLDCYTIQGLYALIRKKIGNKQVFVLVIHTSPTTYKASPDLRSLARHLHATKTYPNYNKIGLLHWTIIRGKEWKNKYINSNLSSNWLLTSLRLISSSEKFPVPGPHCVNCKSKACQEVFIERQNDNIGP